MANVNRQASDSAQAGMLSASPRTSDQVGFRFDPLFIPRLKAEHRELLEGFGQIKAFAEQGDWPAAEARLSQFRAVLTEHLVIESVRLYVFLTQACASDPDKLATMRQFSTEMHSIGKAVVKFVEQHSELVGRPDAQKSFVAGWPEIGFTLGDRIRREERSLYPMYEAVVTR
jgi:hypothetical protein